MKIYKTTTGALAADYLASAIQTHLSSGQKVLWFVTGGSSVKVAAEASKKLAGTNLENLYISLTDERFVPVDDSESNWKQLTDAGFKLTGAHAFPVLSNEDMEQTTENYAKILQTVLDNTNYKIGFFGMGPDGHVAALFPNHAGVQEEGAYAVSLTDSPKPPPKRLTMTVRAIKQLDEAVIFACGMEKKKALENLQKDLSLTEQPAQILKSLPKLTIYNDQIGEEI